MEINIKPEIDRRVNSINQQINSRAFRAANALRNAELTVLRGQGSGKVYKRPFSKGSYRASAPGSPPAVRSGDLRRKWKTQIHGGVGGVTPAIVSDTKYAPYLDEGTSKMAPRPFKERVIENAKPKVKSIYMEPYL